MTTRGTAAVSDIALADTVGAGAHALGLELSGRQIEALVAYLRLLERWNATYNLTAVRDPQRMATQHVVDCLAAAAALVRHRAAVPTRRVLDAGSGAGLPGLIFAIVFPDLRVTCVDAVGKKVAFLTQAAATLRLRNATAVHARVQALTEGEQDIIASRAFAALADFVGATRHLLADNGEWMALKGRPPTDEIARLRGVAALVDPLAVPGLAAERCVVWIRIEVCADSTSIRGPI